MFDRTTITLCSRLAGYLEAHPDCSQINLVALGADLTRHDNGPYLTPQSGIGLALKALGWNRVHQRRGAWQQEQRAWVWLPAPPRIGRPPISMRSVAASRPWALSKPWIGAGVSRATWYRRRGQA